MIASAYAAHMPRRASEFGVYAPGPVSVDLAAAQRRARDIVEPRRRALEDWLSGIDGCKIVRGHARFVGLREIAVGERRLRAHNVFLDVGGRASAPSWPGLDEAMAVKYRHAFAEGDPAAPRGGRRGLRGP